MLLSDLIKELEYMLNRYGDQKAYIEADSLIREINSVGLDDDNFIVVSDI